MELENFTWGGNLKSHGTSRSRMAGKTRTGAAGKDGFIDRKLALNRQIMWLIWELVRDISLFE